MLSGFPVFYRLNDLAIRQWDEARNAVSAVEMYQNKNHIVRYFDHSPDYWDVKPPLLIWAQDLCIGLLGVNELSVRLPSAIAVMLTIVFLIFYFHKYQHNRYAGYIAALILATSQGYMDRHIARTGDHDALLVLFTTMILFLFYEFMKNKNTKLLFILMLLLVAGVYTKSIAVMMIMPGMIVMALLNKKLIPLLTNKWFYINLFIFIAVCLSYYLIRNKMQPGYLKAVWTGELLPRYLNTYNEFNKDPGLYYVKNLFHERFTYWIFMLVPAIFWQLFQYRREKQGIFLYILINAVVFMVIISMGTKNLWYDAPLYPLFAVLIALWIIILVKLLKEKLHFKPVFKNILVIVLIVSLVIYPYIKIVKKAGMQKEEFWNEEIYAMSYVLRDLSAYPDLLNREFSVVYEGYSGHLLFYIRQHEIKGNAQISLKNKENIKPGDYILISQELLNKEIKAGFRTEVLFQQNRVVLYKINDVL